jgi:pimeloyl-ACP methyl ester carboxylesterase
LRAADRLQLDEERITVPPPYALHRRKFLRDAALALAAAQLVPVSAAHAAQASAATHTWKGVNMTSFPIANGPGSVSQAPNLPEGFTDTFSSRLIDTGDVRLHAVIGGNGPALLLVHGWPESWYAWRMVMPALARDFQVVAVDQRGIGLSDKPKDGYDTGSLANDLVGLMDALAYTSRRRFAVFGTDTGMPIAYALAADHPDRVDRLIVAEAPLPGVAPSPPLILSSALNERYYHILFNRTAAVNEQLVRGREDIYFGNEFEIFAARKLPDYAIRYYINQIASDPEALSAQFNWYRAIDTTVTQNEQRKTQRLTMPVLAIGGEKSAGQTVATTMRLAADDVQGAVIPGSGHWIAEEAPDDVVATLSAFLAPYRDANAQANGAATGTPA